MDNKLSELSKPVMYSLRFRNMHTGEPYKNINADTTFSTLEKAKAYGLGTRYVTQDDGKMVRVRDTSRDPIVEPLYSQEYASALIQRAERLDSMLTESVQALKDAEQLIAYLETIRSDTSEVLKEIGNELGCNPDNESIMMAIDALKERLATPVRLPTEHELHQVSCSECAGNCLELVERTLRAAGFKVEGDE